MSSGSAGFNWNAVDGALRYGRCGLSGGSSLARLLARERGVRNIQDLPRLSLERILAWADEYYRRTGRWPTRDSGSVGDAAPGVTWKEVNLALQRGARGLPGASSLPGLLAERRGVRSKGHLPPLSVEWILVWADAHHARHGAWPNPRSGADPGSPGRDVGRPCNRHCGRGCAGSPGGSSLARLFAERRGIRNSHDRPPLTIAEILGWADAYHARTGRWPKSGSGPIAEAPGETLESRSMSRLFSLYQGLRGLLGGSSLPRLLARERGVRNEKHLPLFRIPDILRWADAYHHRHDKWPTCQSGAIPESPDDDWRRVNEALSRGLRGLRGGYSLARLLADRRGVRNVTALPPLTEEQVLAWADAHRARTGRWPAIRSGPIPEAPGETWQGVQNALRLGLRGLPGGSSLARLLARERGVHNAASPSGQPRTWVNNPDADAGA